MHLRKFLILTFAAIGLVVVSACGTGDSAGPAASDSPGATSMEPEVIEWSIGPKGGLGEGSAFITQASWEPKRLEVPVGRPFKIRFMPRDQRHHPIVFGTSLQEEVGVELPVLDIRDGQPTETPVMTINSRDKAFDVFCREHRGVNGFGSIVTPP